MLPGPWDAMVKYASWGNYGGGNAGTIRAGVPPEKKIGKTIGWYNRSGVLQEEIRYSEVAPLMSQLDPAKAGQILAQLESKAAEVKNPTAWLSSAARKAGAVSGMGYMPEAAMYGGGGGYWMECDPKISKTIGWYNKQNILQERIEYNEVAPLLAQLDPSRAGRLLKQLEEKASEVKNPTAWLAHAARKSGAGTVSELDPKVRKLIGWYNKEGKLQGPIQFTQVEPLLSQLPPNKALHIVNCLEGKEAEIKDPTAWISSAARKAGAM